ncbi:MAG: sigma-E processing peptidase SpoIIGA [Bacilli bacterium]|nr:sigma-E processing peptidase SpoIIGA [Bacilli bacterium]
MTLYLDLIFLLNLGFDFILLLSVSVLLRRNVKIKKIILGSVIGSLSIFVLFIKINSIQLFFIKFIISVIMIIISFGYKNIKYTLKNLLYLYISSILLGGFLYYLNVEFSYKQEGLVFYHHGLSINYILLIIISPIIIYTYVRQGIKLKTNYANYYEIELFLTKDNSISLTGFVDTGNKITDPFFKRPVILVNKSELGDSIKDLKSVLIPYHTVSNNGLIKCVIPYQIVIKGVGIKKKFLVGIVDEDFKIEGINCILHNQLLEG